MGKDAGHLSVYALGMPDRHSSTFRFCAKYDRCNAAACQFSHGTANVLLTDVPKGMVAEVEFSSG